MKLWPLNTCKQQSFPSTKVKKVAIEEYTRKIDAKCLCYICKTA